MIACKTLQQEFGSGDSFCLRCVSFVYVMLNEIAIFQSYFKGGDKAPLKMSLKFVLLFSLPIYWIFFSILHLNIRKIIPQVIGIVLDKIYFTRRNCRLILYLLASYSMCTLFVALSKFYDQINESSFELQIETILMLMIFAVLLCYLTSSKRKA